MAQPLLVSFHSLVLAIADNTTNTYFRTLIRIIIYDDNQQRRASLQALLALTDHLICVGDFADCSDVLNQVTALQPDVILMDIEMPHVDGIAGVGIIKKHFPQIRIIMQTVYEDDDKIFACLQAGAEGYILKDAGAEKITQCIEEVYQGGAYMTPSVALRVMQFFNKSAVVNEAFNLTPKEKEVLKLLADGNSYKMIADILGNSYFTVNSHIKKIYEKLQVNSASEAVSKALKNKIV